MAGLVLMTSPFQHVLGLIPKGVLAGLFVCPPFLKEILKEIKLTKQSLIAQGSEFPLRKPPGFHWDFFLLGFVLFASGILGLPASNGMSLCFVYHGFH